MKRFIFALFCLITACDVSRRVVTVIVPYTPVLYLQSTSPWLGAADCDLQGHPVIYLHPALDKDIAPWVLIHEQIHVEQMKAWGGCTAFSKHIRADSMFRLRSEAEAFCGVLTSQRKVHFQSNPTYDTIVGQLINTYGFAYERDSVIAALPCKEEG